MSAATILMKRLLLSVRCAMLIPGTDKVCLLTGTARKFIRLLHLWSDRSPCEAQALLFRTVIGQGPPAELVYSSFVAPRFDSAQSEPLAGHGICCLTFLIYTSPPSHTASPDLTNYN
uniref:Secreted protein n=1 Tax=Knipowitschia caucasica TaxID=637954 RepID=A0AAV2JMA9_KNICA